MSVSYTHLYLAEKQSEQQAARTPLTLLAAIEMPMPVQMCIRDRGSTAFTCAEAAKAGMLSD